MTQTQLNTACNFPANTIKKLEGADYSTRDRPASDAKSPTEDRPHPRVDGTAAATAGT